MKILYITTIGITMGFFKSIVRELIDSGNVVDIATNEKVSEVPKCFREWGCSVYNISTSRSPFSFGNLRAIKEIKSVAKNYDIVHCHTPLAGMATRFACKTLRKKQGLKVVYTAHGFHFYKGAPLKNWLIYYPIEKMCSKWTDVLITINKEDFEFARKKMKAKTIKYIPGVGINVDAFSNCLVDKDKKKKELELPSDAIVILSVGELNSNKNHKIVIEAVSKLDSKKIYYLIAGQGRKKEYLERLANKLNVNIKLLGFRDDIKELYKIADVFILPSIREGLNVSIMEALSSGCPVLASNIRGNVDMISPKNCFNPFDADELASLLSDRNYSCDRSFTKLIDYKTINKAMFSLYDIKDYDHN